MTNYLSALRDPHHDIGLLDVTDVDTGVNYEGVVVWVYSKLPTVTPFFRDYERPYDGVIMGKSQWCNHDYNEWDELYWPFTRMVIEQRVMESGSSDEESDDDERSLFSDHS